MGGAYSKNPKLKTRSRRNPGRKNRNKDTLEDPDVNQNTDEKQTLNPRRQPQNRVRRTELTASKTLGNNTDNHDDPGNNYISNNNNNTTDKKSINIGPNNTTISENNESNTHSIDIKTGNNNESNTRDDKNPNQKQPITHNAIFTGNKNAEHKCLEIEPANNHYISRINPNYNEEIESLGDIYYNTHLDYEKLHFDVDGTFAGVTLKEYQTKYGVPGLTEDDISIFAYQIIYELFKIHQNNILHAQLRPSNIFFAKDKSCLTFEGHLASNSDAGCNISTNVLSTEMMPYYPPEILSRISRDTKSSDIWCFGMVLMELCLGCVNFTDEEKANINDEIIYSKFSVDTSYSDNLILFIIQCLQAEACRRPTAEELLYDQYFHERELSELEALHILFSTPKYRPLLAKTELTDRIKRYTKNKAKLPLNVDLYDENPETLDLFFSCFATFTRIDSLHLQDCRMRSEGLNYMIGYLSYLTDVRDLNLSNNCLKVDGAERLSRILPLMTSLMILNLGINNFGVEGNNTLWPKIKYLSRLQELRMDMNNISKESCGVVSASLEHLRNLIILDISKNEINSDGISFISQCFKYLPKLKSLDISRNSIEQYGLKSLSQELKYLKELRHLDLHTNKIGDSGATYLFSSFKYIQNLQHLNISDINITVQSLNKFAENMEYASSLRSLNLKGNDISSEGLTLLTKYFCNIPNLNVLDLTNTNIDNWGLKNLTDKIEELAFLTELYLLENNIHSNYIEEIRSKKEIPFIK